MAKCIPLTNAQIEQLEKWPENGMGYQIADLTLKDGTVLRNVPIMNCCEALLIRDSGITAQDITSFELSKKPKNNGS